MGVVKVDLVNLHICEWEEDHDGNYDTNCNNKFILLSGSLAESGFEYCPYCGRKIKLRGGRE